jgi:hypothetical protein
LLGILVRFDIFVMMLMLGWHVGVCGEVVVLMLLL